MSLYDGFLLLFLPTRSQLNNSSLLIRINMRMSFSNVQNLSTTYSNNCNIAWIISFLSLRLFGNAKYVVDGNQQVLYLDGRRSYAEVPAVDIKSTSFTLSCWIKIPSYSNSHGAIFGDWSSPYQFRIYVNPNGGFCAQLRGAGRYRPFDIIGTCRYLHLNHILYYLPVNIWIIRWNKEDTYVLKRS